MKKILALVAAVTTLGFAVPSETQAWDQCNHHTRIVSYLPCGRPVYAVYQIYGHDRCGNPLGRWVTQRSSCGCSVCNPRSHHHCPSHNGYSRIYSPPPRSGVSWSFSFGR